MKFYFRIPYLHVQFDGTYHKIHGQNTHCEIWRWDLDQALLRLWWWEHLDDYIHGALFRLWKWPVFFQVSISKSVFTVLVIILLNFRGTSGIDIDLRRVDINQCPPRVGVPKVGVNIFGGTDKCKNETTFVSIYYPITKMRKVGGRFRALSIIFWKICTRKTFLVPKWSINTPSYDPTLYSWVAKIFRVNRCYFLKISQKVKRNAKISKI